MNNPAEQESISETIGTRFKRERENQHKSIEDVAAATCIHLRSLMALENDNYDQLPAPVFTKGFIKIYAEYLGLDQEEILSHYVSTSTNSLKEVNLYNQEIISSDHTDDREKTSFGVKIVTAFALLFVGFFLYIVFGIMFPTAPIQQISLETKQQAAVNEDIFKSSIEIEEETVRETKTKEPAAITARPSFSPVEKEVNQERAATNQQNSSPAPVVVTEKAETKITAPDLASEKSEMIAEVSNKQAEAKAVIIAQDKTPIPTEQEIIPAAAEEEAEENIEIETPDSNDDTAIADLQPETIAETRPEPAEKPEQVAEFDDEPQILAITPDNPQTDISEIQEDAEISGTEEPSTTKTDNPTPIEEEFNYILKADFIEPTWLRVRVDGERPRQYTYRAGTSKEWKAKEQIRLHIGNAAGLKLFLNGTPLDLAGEPGKVIRLSIPRDLP
ncbi:MAG: DUF4115 domain-containing protein [Proteobacteria bacterium]|nr:DUF4115 domain-containing protein [Pseudomonadota bacterium]MBU1716946.1 DUF4115 domain-containing protein [Pseudomonadota bacterium]